MHILYFHQHFTTPQGSGGIRSYEFSRYLIKQGYEVTIVCGSFANGDTNLIGDFKKGIRKGIVDGINIIELDLPYSNNLGFFSRSIIFIQYSLRSIKLIFQLKYDLLLASSTPLTVAIPGIISRIFTNKPFIFEVRDLWPELPISMGVIRNPLIILLLKFLEKTSYKVADHIIALSPGMVRGIKRKTSQNKPISLIPNGCDLDFFKSPTSRYKDKKINQDFLTIYTGTHGIANGLNTLIDAAKILKDKEFNNIKILMVGDGSEKQKLIEKASFFGLDNISFLDPQSKEDISSVFEKADLGLQILKNVPEFYYGTSPNKFFDYISNGLPVLFNYPGWLADLNDDFNFGYQSKPDDAADLASKMILASKDKDIDKKGENAYHLACSNFNRKNLAKEFETVIRNTLPGSL